MRKLGPFRFGYKFKENILPQRGFFVDAKAVDIYKKKEYTLWGITFGMKFFGFLSVVEYTPEVKSDAVRKVVSK